MLKRLQNLGRNKVSMQDITQFSKFNGAATIYS